jgi:hypothetical protein
MHLFVAVLGKHDAEHARSFAFPQNLSLVLLIVLVKLGHDLVEGLVHMVQCLEFGVESQPRSPDRPHKNLAMTWLRNMGPKP